MAAGARKQELDYLPKTPGIRPEDCWAMLAWAYNQETVKNPGKIMAMNLMQGEKASADWYEESRWTSIPLEIRHAGGLANHASSDDNAGSIDKEDDGGPDDRSTLVTQSQEKQVNNQSVVAIRSSEENKPTETLPSQWWKTTKELLKADMPKLAFDVYVLCSEPVFFENGLLEIAVGTEMARSWLEERLTSKAQHLLCGVANQTIELKFVVERR